MEKPSKLAEMQHTFYAAKFDAATEAIYGWGEEPVRATLSEVPECLRESIALLNLLDSDASCELGTYWRYNYDKDGRVYWVVVPISVAKSWQKLWGKEECKDPQ